MKEQEQSSLLRPRVCCSKSSLLSPCGERLGGEEESGDYIWLHLFLFKILGAGESFPKHISALYFSWEVLVS